MYKTWNEDFADTLRKYVDEQITYPRTLGVPLNPCYGKTRVTPKVERAIFNPPATIIIWNDGTKSVVKCQNGEPFDAEKGFALAYLKKLLGNDNTFNKEIKKWVKWDEPVTIDQLMMMDGKKVYVVSLDENCVEDFDPKYSGWRTVNTRHQRVYADNGFYFSFDGMGDNFGFHAYLTEKKKV